MHKTTQMLSAAALLVGACNNAVEPDDRRGFPSSDGGNAEGGSETSDAGAGSDAGEDGGAPAIPEGCLMPSDFDAPKGYPTFAVQNSDYSTASISLLDETGKVLDAEYLGAGSDIEGISTGLHSDVTLPTTPGEPTVLAVIARAMGDYVLRMDLGEAEVINLIATQADPFAMDDPGAAWASNPYDYLYVNEETAFVTRFSPNLDPDASAMERGDDILVVDPSTGERLERIALDEWVETVDADDGAGGTMEVKVFARPSRLLGMGCHALVGTARLSGDFSVGNDQGAIGLLDLREKSVEKIEIDTLRNCGDVLPVARDAERALVQCAGSNPYGDPGSAGIALLHVDAGGNVEVEHTLVREGNDDPVLSSGAVSLGGTRIAVVANGDFSEGTNDIAYVVDMENGEREELFEGTGPYTLGSGTFDASRGRLYIPDANVGVRVFEEDADGFTELDAIEIDPLLPPRSIRPLRAL